MPDVDLIDDNGIWILIRLQQRIDRTNSAFSNVIWRGK
jgi:hypothetical protein